MHGCLDRSLVFALEFRTEPGTLLNIVSAPGLWEAAGR